MKKGKLLIIDDNEDILFALNLLLEPYMEQIRVATQPERIDHFMRTFIPDIILLDMNFKRDAISGQEGFYWLEKKGIISGLERWNLIKSTGHFVDIRVFKWLLL